jgi:iron(II)-dependent oxidoreductase
MQRKGHERPMLIFDDEQPVRPASSRLAGDAEIPALEGMFGAPDDDELADPGQRPERVVTVGGFRIARAPVTESEFLQFVEDGGYGNRDLWTEAGWVLTRAEDRRAPRYWQQRDGVWFRRDFDRWDELAERRPVSYVSAHEAEAYCRWAGRRLPTEEEWEAAASWKPDGAERSLYPWGIMPPQPALACLDGRELEPPSVDAFAAGDSAFGLRQMLGNVWEWTSSDMDTARVIRGGSFATRSRLLTCRTRRGLAPACDLMPTGFRSVER